MPKVKTLLSSNHCNKISRHYYKFQRNDAVAGGDSEEVNGAHDIDASEIDEEEEFNDLLAELGINGLVEDTETIKAMWLDLKRNDGDPLLMENYEAFLAKLAKDIQQKATEQGCYSVLLRDSYY